jgi:hypothetical protein
MRLHAYALGSIIKMSWVVLFATEFLPEFSELPEDVKDALFIHARWIEAFGPEAGRPRVDTLKGSKFPNMKELRFEAADGAWRVAFAFDPERKALLLIAGDKSGVSQKKFYKKLIDKADSRYRSHLEALRKLDSSATRKKAEGKKR